MARWAPDAATRLETAAMELFAEQGYGATTVPEIARRAGLTTRTFFRHFADKREVLFLRDREFPQVVRAALAGFEEQPASLDLVMRGFETVARGQLSAWRSEIRSRRDLIATVPALQERELLKSSALAEAIRDVLADRGMPRADAAILSDVAAVLFSTALDEWLDSDETVELVDVLTGVRARLSRVMGAPALSRGR